MQATMTPQQVLDREYLEMRAKVLELAASFDRLDQGDKTIESDRRIQLLLEGIATLNFNANNRAEKVQMIFSREYAENWREEFGI